MGVNHVDVSLVCFTRGTTLAGEAHPSTGRLLIVAYETCFQLAHLKADTFVRPRSYPKVAVPWDPCKNPCSVTPPHYSVECVRCCPKRCGRNRTLQLGQNTNRVNHSHLLSRLYHNDATFRHFIVLLTSFKSNALFPSELGHRVGVRLSAVPLVSGIHASPSLPDWFSPPRVSGYTHV